MCQGRQSGWVQHGEGTEPRVTDRIAGVVIISGDELFQLAVAPGNTRARGFYERRGWVDDGPMTYAAPSRRRAGGRAGTSLRQGS